MNINPELDLEFIRTVDLPANLIWDAWTKPELLKPWFCPKPWKTVACEIDLRRGGKFATTMQSPEGELFPNEGCYLEVVEQKKLVWTDALTAGYRPAQKSHLGFGFTGVIELEAHSEKTLYKAYALHALPEHRKQHADMGFEEGWGMALNQLIEFMKVRHSL